MRNLSFVCLVFLIAVIANAQPYLVGATFLDSTSNQYYSTIGSKAKFDVKFYKITYNTTDVDGSSTVASGALAIPMHTACDSLPSLVYEHGTVLLKTDVPSRNNGEAFLVKAFASAGFVSVSTDYLGLGDNPGLHPYLWGEGEATATLDLLRAAREFISDSTDLNLNGDLVVTGYSQGGHAAMATVKYIKKNNLESEFNVVAAGPASGPYNLAGVQAEGLISNQPYGDPGYICYLLFGMNRVYGNLYQNYSDILKPPYDTLIPPLFDGNHSMSAVNAVLPDTISGFLRDSVLANFKNDSVNKTHPLWQALLANDNHNWQPDFPMQLYYCTQDEQVDYHNALVTETTMQGLGANVNAMNEGVFNHSGCVVPSLMAALDFFYTKASVCTQKVGVDELRAQSEKVSIYPVPANGKIFFKGMSGKAHIDVFNTSGQKLYSAVISLDVPFDVHAFPKGIYLLHLVKNGQSLDRKIILE